MKRLWLPLVLFLTACRGSAPIERGSAEGGYAAILIGARARMAGGEALGGEVVVNLESEGGRQAQVYRLVIPTGKASLFRLEPGDYRIKPARSLLGFQENGLSLRLEGRRHRVPFPRELLRRSTAIKPERLAALGVIDIAMAPSRTKEEPEVKVRFDESASAKRDLLQGAIRDMLDSELAPADREAAISWSRALERSLVELQTERTSSAPDSSSPAALQLPAAPSRP